MSKAGEVFGMIILTIVYWAIFAGISAIITDNWHQLPWIGVTFVLAIVAILGTYFGVKAANKKNN
jgi:uncharacterized membrane protein YedE/YeeE